MPTLPNGHQPDVIMDDIQLAIAEWSPAQDYDGNPTQVHIILELPEVCTFITRFKSRKGLDNFIADLTAARDRVWGQTDAEK